LIIVKIDLLHKTTSIHQVNVSQSYLYSAGLIKAKLKPYSKWNIKYMSTSQHIITRGYINRKMFHQSQI